ncbi:hypothetical protein [Halorubrum sp. PV6]|uniref:hypothetical protein n=1 Tax=Halorubrum sp. PV6 TaxID=634157 RepID=UPI000F84EB32|nr:hypothetical protein [Halorubrum sp. PV6]AZQ15436.1 hypothetical protein DOS48_11665 [Halorubrum sp. PV6]
MTDDPDRAASHREDDTTDEPTTPTEHMSDTDIDDAGGHTPSSTDAGRDATESDSASDGGFRPLSTDRLRGIIDRVGLVALLLLALIAGWGFYTQAGRAIRTWLDPAYQPIALAAFNLVVLLVALAGVAHQLYRIRRSERGGDA